MSTAQELETVEWHYVVYGSDNKPQRKGPASKEELKRAWDSGTVCPSVSVGATCVIFLRCSVLCSSSMCLGVCCRIDSHLSGRMLVSV